MLEKITIEDCERLYKKGWCVILADGVIKGFRTEVKKDTKQSLHNETN